MAAVKESSMEHPLDSKRVKDLMLALSEYAVVPEDTTFREALRILDEAQRELPPGRQPHRAVLVVDQAGKVVGKAGQLAFLKALEPKYDALGDLGTLARAGLTREFVTSIMENMRFWQDSLSINCRRAGALKIKDFMVPTTECIDEDAPLTEAIHRIVVGQTLSLLATRHGEVVGILRLSDLFDEIANHMAELGTGD
jgi:CBS domain-containing protein